MLNESKMWWLPLKSQVEHESLSCYVFQISDSDVRLSVKVSVSYFCGDFTLDEVCDRTDTASCIGLQAFNLDDHFSFLLSLSLKIQKGDLPALPSCFILCRHLKLILRILRHTT